MHVCGIEREMGWKLTWCKMLSRGPGKRTEAILNSIREFRPFALSGSIHLVSRLG